MLRADLQGYSASGAIRRGKHNVGSIRVLEKCDFSLEREKSVEVAGQDVAELVLVLR